MSSALFCFVLIAIYVACATAECPYGSVWNYEDGGCRIVCGRKHCIPEFEECDEDNIVCKPRPLCNGIRCGAGEECVFHMECVIPCGKRGSFAHCQPRIEQCINEECVPLV